MIAKVQMLAKRLGEGGCYFLTLLGVCEEMTGEAYDVVLEFDTCIKQGFVKEDGFMSNVESMMAHFCGGAWSVLWAGNGKRSNNQVYDLPLDYVCAGGEFDVLRYERQADPRLGETEPMPHFVRGDGKGKLALGGDPWGNSRTCREGKLISRRILRRVM